MGWGDKVLLWWKQRHNIIRVVDPDCLNPGPDQFFTEQKQQLNKKLHFRVLYNRLLNSMNIQASE